MLYWVFISPLVNGTINPHDDKLYTYGETPEYVFTANPNYILKEVRVNNRVVEVVGNRSYRFPGIRRDMRLQAIFESVYANDIYTVSVVNDLVGVEVTPSVEMQYFRDSTPHYIITSENDLSGVIVPVHGKEVYPLVESSNRWIYEFAPIQGDCIFKLE
jgi:hypothetical protein